VPTIPLWQAGGGCPRIPSVMSLVTDHGTCLTQVRELAGGDPPSGSNNRWSLISRPLLLVKAGTCQELLIKPSITYHQVNCKRSASGSLGKMFLPVVATAGHPHFSRRKNQRCLLFNGRRGHCLSTQRRGRTSRKSWSQLQRLSRTTRGRDLGDQGQPGEGMRPDREGAPGFTSTDEE